MKPIEEMEYILATDVGSTTTKARLFKNINGEWRFVIAGEAPTTVETPYEDVTMGVRNAIREIEELTEHKILSEDDSNIVVPCQGNIGVDFYCTTSSAGGGLQMTVMGVVKTITAESAHRAALGAGAIVMDITSIDDGRKVFQRIKRIRSLRPDMILLAGGTDGGTVSHIIDLAQMLRVADPKARFGLDYKLPLLYAGNKDVRPQIEKLFDENFVLTIVDNLRPSINLEDTEPARREIHELFMEHVMSHAPGYLNLMKWTDVDIMPTPAGEGIAMQLVSKLFHMNTIGVGLGGATTNIYSIFDDRFVRSVSANLGMSYSICNVMKETGIENILRWLPFGMDEVDLRNRITNKMIRPTTIPQTLEELILEHSVAREALRLGLEHHKTIATRLKGVRREGGVVDLFDQAFEETYINLINVDVVAGTGGLLSHAPRRVQGMLIMIDGWQLEGVTRVVQDSVFMMPHLGVLSTVYEDAAINIFDKDCLVRLGTVIAPKGLAEEGEDVVSIKMTMPDDTIIEEYMKFGEIKCIPLQVGQEAEVIITPHKDFDVGAGQGHRLDSTVMGGQVGIILDARGRPLQLPNDSETRMERLLKWFVSLDLYPQDILKKLCVVDKRGLSS